MLVVPWRGQEDEAIYRLSISHVGNIIKGNTLVTSLNPFNNLLMCCEGHQDINVFNCYCCKTVCRTGARSLSVTLCLSLLIQSSL